MKRFLRRALALCLACVLVLSATACKKDSDKGSDSSNSNQNAAATNGKAGMEGWTKFAENVTLKIPVYDRGAGSNGVADVVNNDWTAWVQKNFGDAWNITVKYVPITRSDVLTDYALLAADKNLPTICAEYDYPKMTQWINDGYLVPYDMNQFKTVAPTYYSRMEGSGLLGMTKVGGQDYLAFGTRAYGFSTYTWATFYRLDWVKAAGYDKFPEKLSDQIECYKKIKALGLCDYPLGGTRVTGAGVDQNHGYRTYPQDETLWATTGDYNIPALSTEAQKRLLKVVNEEYNLGLIDPEFDLKEASDAQADFINGKCFQFGCYLSSTIATLESFYAENPNGEVGLMVCPGYVTDDKYGWSTAYRAGLNLGAYVGFSSMASDNEKLAAMMYLEWLAQPANLFTFQWGTEGKNFNYVDGNPVAISTEGMGHNSNVDYWMLVEAIKSIGNIDLDCKAISPQNLPKDFTADIIANYNGQLDVYNKGYANVDCYFATAIEAEADYAQTLYSKYEEYRTKLTKCAPSEFDALYDELSKKYLADGYQAVIDGRKAAFDAGNGTHLAK
ncbi:MAG: sugar ABC transporter substrate-binding protein [Lachnospiraceae bacterium]|nr:sugar ABC transporter substrate-binding protein [Lachnospiraceae bacterium]